MTTAIGLVVLAGAACAVSLVALQRLFRDDAAQRQFAQRPDIEVDAFERLRDSETELESQVSTLRTMILQLRAELAESQRENEQARLRALELLRFREADLARETEARAGSGSDKASRRRDESFMREALGSLALR